MFETTWTLLTPSSLLVGVLLVAYVSAFVGWHRLATSLLGLALLALLALAFLPLDDWAAAPLENAVEPAPLPAHVDGVVVLGGSVDWRVTKARGQISLDDAGERMLAALALARRYPAATIVFTGLFDDAIRADWKDADGRGLLWQPVLEGRDVRFLGGVSSTYEEAIVARDSVAPAPGQTWLLVTSALHMPRALGTFRTLGWGVVPFPVDYRTTGTSAWRFEPRVGARLASLDRVVREWGALLVYRRTGRIDSVERGGSG